MMTDVNSFLMGTGGRSAKFANHGDQIDGYIVSMETRQQTTIDGERMFWDDGNPREQLVVTLQVNDEPEDDEDDLLRRVYVRGQMTQAVRKAVLDAKQRGLAKDGRLFVRYVSDAVATRKGFSGAKQYTARYQPPQVQVPIDDEEGEPMPDPDDAPF